MKHLLLTHDVSCALGELARACKRQVLSTTDPYVAVTDLAVAAVALTIQLAIDVADRDPHEMRELERVLIEKLKEPVVLNESHAARREPGT